MNIGVVLELLQVHVEPSIGAVFYLYPDRPAHPASPALAGAGRTRRHRFSRRRKTAGTAAVNITGRVMFGNRNELFYFGLPNRPKLYTGDFYYTRRNYRCEFVIR